MLNLNHSYQKSIPIFADKVKDSDIGRPKNNFYSTVTIILWHQKVFGISKEMMMLMKMMMIIRSITARQQQGNLLNIRQN